MVVRVTTPGSPAFRLRSGEEGLSVFDLEAVDPPLSEVEVLDGFRPGSLTVVRSVAEIEAKGLIIVPVPGVGSLSERLSDAHAEIQAGPGMTRTRFKQILKELE